MSRFIDARHREALQTPAPFLWAGVHLPPVPVVLNRVLVHQHPPDQPPSWVLPLGVIPPVAITNPPIPGRWVAPIHYAESPSSIVVGGITETQQTLVQGINGVTFVDARHREALQTFNWLSFFVPPGSQVTAAPVSRGKVVDPQFDIDEAGSVVCPSIIDPRIPTSIQLVVGAQDTGALSPPSWVFSFTGPQLTVSTTPAPQLCVPYVHDETPFAWVWNWNGAPNLPPTRLSAAAQLVATAKDQWDQLPVVFNWNGSPIIPGVPPAFGASVVAFPIESYDGVSPFVFSGPQLPQAPPPPPVVGGHGNVELDELFGWEEYKRRIAEAKRLHEFRLRKAALAKEKKATAVERVSRIETQVKQVARKVETAPVIEKPYWLKRVEELEGKLHAAQTSANRSEERLNRYLESVKEAEKTLKATEDEKLEKRRREEQEAKEAMEFLMSFDLPKRKQ